MFSHPSSYASRIITSILASISLPQLALPPRAAQGKHRRGAAPVTPAAAKPVGDGEARVPVASRTPGGSPVQSRGFVPAVSSRNASSLDPGPLRRRRPSSRADRGPARLMPIPPTGTTSTAKTWTSGGRRWMPWDSTTGRSSWWIPAPGASFDGEAESGAEFGIPAVLHREGFRGAGGAERKVIQPATKYRLGGMRMDLTYALAHSNNYYFATLGEKLGFERVSLLRAAVRVRREGRAEHRGRATGTLSFGRLRRTAAWGCSPASARRSSRRRCNWRR